MANPYIPKALEAQDLERMKFAQNLRQNPAEYNSYVNDRISSISNEIFNRKRTAFQKAHIDLARYMDMDHNANFYKSRSSDVDRLTSEISANNQRIVQELERDKDLSKRQFEINEWYNSNKLETLFFLQLFFISILLMVVIIYYQKSGSLSGQMAGLLTAVLGAIVVITGVYRWYYTKNTRDPRLWNRRSFGKIAAVHENTCGNKDEDYVIDINKYVPEAVTQCADQIVMDTDSKLKLWQNTLESEIYNYQVGEKKPTSVLSTLTPSICDAVDFS
jgi:hypothetical protein